MFMSIEISKVRKELETAGFNNLTDFSLLRIKDDFTVLSVNINDESYLVNYYEKGCKELAQRYNSIEKLAKNIILPCTFYSDKIMLFKDNNSRLLTIEDLQNDLILDQLLVIYHTLANNKFDGFKKYDDYFTKGNLVKVMELYNFRNNDAFLFLYEHFDNVKKKLLNIKKGLVLERFSLDDYLLSNDKILLSDAKNVCVGSKYKSFLNIESFVVNKSLLIKDFSEDEIIINKVVSSVIELYFDSGLFKKEIDNVIKYVSGNDFLKDVKTVVEWF